MEEEYLEMEITDFWYNHPAGFPTSAIGGVTAAVSYILSRYRLTPKVAMKEE